MNHAKIESMDHTLPAEAKERNPITHQRHRKETLWQITIPTLVIALGLLIFSLLSTQLIPDEASRWADISLIWLITPVMLVTLITFATLVMSIYATVKLIQALPFFSFRLHRYLILIGAYLRLYSDRAVEPILRLRSFTASAKSLKRQILRK